MPIQSSSTHAQHTPVVAYRRRTVLVCAIAGAALSLTAISIAGYELATFLRTSRYDAITAGQLWFESHVPSLNLVQAVVQRYIDPRLWDPLLVSVLRWPLWSLLGGTGLMLVAPFAARRR